MQEQSAPAPSADLTPDSFMAAQPAPAATPPHEESSSFLDKAKALGETALPLLFHKAQQETWQPLAPESVVPYAQPQTPLQSVAHSAGEFARGLTSPGNLAIGALAGPVAKIAPLLSRAVSAGFGVQMLKQAYDQYPDIRDAVSKGDWTKAAGAITTAVLF